MSYYLVADRSFIRTSTGIIPLVLVGDSSLTDNHGKVILHWSLLRPDQLNAPASVALEKIKKDVSKYNAPSRVDAFYWRGRFLKMDKLPAWYAKGCSDAHTLEEYLATNPNQKHLKCEVVLQFKGKIGGQALSPRYCTTTAELDNWLSDAMDEVRSLQLLKSCNDQEIEDAYINIGFSEPQEMRSMASSGSAVIAKCGKNSYVKSYVTGKELSFTSQQEDAIVFESVQDAVAKLGMVHDLKFVKAPKNIGNRSYVLKCERWNGESYYFQYRERRRFVQTRCLEEAKRFASLKEVERYVASLRNAGYGSYVYHALNIKTGEETTV